MDKSPKNEYKLYKLARDLYGYLRKYVIINIPKVHTDIKIHLMDEMYYLTKNILFSSFNVGNIRSKYLKECKVNISMIDMFLEEIKHVNAIEEKKYLSCLHRLSDIKNFVYGWYANEFETV